MTTATPNAVLQDALNALASYTAGQRMTADQLARHFAVQAYATLTGQRTRDAHREWKVAGLPEDGALRDAYVQALRAAAAEYALVYLLREVGPNSMRADDLAWRAMTVNEGDAEEAVADLEGWLAEYGIDPQAIPR